MNTTVRAPAAASRALRPLPVLRLLYAGDRGPLVVPPHILRTGEIAIGRESRKPGSLMIAGDHRISREHALLHHRASDGQLRIEDLRSTNGTFVNGVRVSDTLLQPGDVIRVGDSILLVAVAPADSLDGEVPSLLGTSTAARGLRSDLARVAPTEATVLLLGETGTGKEVAAQAIHRLSPRAGQPILVLDCGAISGNLVESELFGYEKGAFTGAAQSRKGLFEGADGGTLFIDELGELPLDLQPKLLRALEQREIRRLGAGRPIPIDVRIIAATNRDLAAEVRAGRFRADLYARLAELTIALPPLRERRDDVLQLLVHALGTTTFRLIPDLAAALVLHSWPYNVREVYKVAVQLRTFPTPERQMGLIEKLRSEATQGGADRRPEQEGDPAAAPATPTGPPVPSITLPLPRRNHGRPTADQIAELLRQHQGNVSEVARVLGISRRHLHRWLHDYDLSGDDFRRGRNPDETIPS